MKQKVYFRADAGSNIGYGHFIRSLALADMLKDDFDCTVFTQTPTDYQCQEVAKVCALAELPSDDTKFGKFLDCLTGEEIVVLDNYFYTTDYQCRIREKGCKLVCIDDMHDKHYVADVVINHGTDRADVFSVEPYTRLCIGLEWALLRKPFLQTFHPEKKESGHCLIAFGGSDENNLTGTYLSQALASGSFRKISVVLGDAYRHAEDLPANEAVAVYRNLSAQEMADLMESCEYAILPSSGICLEALSRGCKVMVRCYVDNQQGMCEYLSSLSSIEVDFSAVPQKYKVLFSSLKTVYQTEGLLFVDYTVLSQTDHQKIWQARNHEEIRRHMDSSDEIPWENHCRFVEGLKRNPHRKYWAVYQDDSLIASVNISYLSETRVERGIFMLPSVLGKSLGSRVEDATVALLKTLGIKEIEAKVLKENEKSMYFHQKHHYQEAGGDERYVYLLRKL